MQLEEILSYFARLIEDELGIVYSEVNYFQLENRLEEISKLSGYSGIVQLHAEALKGLSGAAKQLLFDLATNNETSFFRDPKVFKSLELSLKEILSQRGSKEPLRIWSAASSTGQEALTISILLTEWKTKNQVDFNFEITATDISDRVLKRAKSFEYSQLEIQRGLPAPLLIKYFTKDNQDKWLASKQVSKNIQHKSLNLKSQFTFPDRFDVIFCRNVLIYQNIQRKIEILDRVTSCLCPGGLLIVGSGESVVGLSSEYEHVHIDGAIFYRKKQMRLNAA